MKTRKYKVTIESHYPHYSDFVFDNIRNAAMFMDDAVTASKWDDMEITMVPVMEEEEECKTI